MFVSIGYRIDTGFLVTSYQMLNGPDFEMNKIRPPAPYILTFACVNERTYNYTEYNAPDLPR